MIKQITIPIVVAAVAYGFYFLWISLLIANGYSAKYACSSIFIGNRNLEELTVDLDMFPIRYSTVQVNHTDRSVTSSIMGFAEAKAIYRDGFGATLINQLKEEEDIRQQKYSLVVSSNDSREEIPWPIGDQIDETNHLPYINKIELNKVVDTLFNEKDPNQPIRTRAVLVVYDGQIVSEKYAPGFSKETKFLGWSMTKSIINALIGILVKDHRLNIDEFARIPEWKDPNDPRHKITVRHLLQQKSGLDFNEYYYGKSHITEMLYLSSDMASSAASRPLKFPPGTHPYYSSGNTNILSRLIRHTVGDDQYHRFLYEKLLSKLGMHSLVIETDVSGTFVGSSYGWGTVRDWARFGLLYLNKGFYNNEQILTEQWIQETVTLAGSNQYGQHGLHFWLNTKPDNDSYTQKYPDAPSDMFCASGFNGQNVFIIPSEKLVIVRFGLTRTPKEEYGASQFIRTVINTIRSK